MPHLLAVDGNSLAHRAFHAVGDEERVGAYVAGAMVRMIASVWAYGPYDGVVVGFDHARNRRKADDPGYKAHRPDKHPDLLAQLAALPGQLAQVGFDVRCEDGAEADDVLAATAAACEQRGWRCTLLSSDRDLIAYVSASTTLLRPRASMTDMVVTTPAQVRAEYGVEPRQYTDLAALRGDPSDGLSGCPGIGAKTASRLLRRHRDVPGLFGALSYLEPRLEAALRAGRADVERNLWLMAPLPGVVVDVESVGALDLDAAETALVALDLGWAAGRLRAAVERPAPPPMPPAPEQVPDDAPGPSAVPARVAREFAPVHTGQQSALF